MRVQRYHSPDGPVTLGTRIGKGGEGEVYGISGRDDLAAKIYTLANLGDRAEKIELMTALGMHRITQNVALPISTLKDDSGRTVGFVMKRVEGHNPLHELVNPKSRKQAFPKADYRFLVRSAANLCRAVAQAHRVGCVIGDLNQSGVLVANSGTVTLIDADSFQLTTRDRVFRCSVGVAEYTPPELQRTHLGTSDRTVNHDSFGVAVAVFQLLCMGRHPYVGRPRSGDVPQISDAISSNDFAYSQTRETRLSPPPGTISLETFPKPIGDSFERAFSPLPTSPRPLPAEWAKNLSELETSLERCSADPFHYFPPTARTCPWCEMESKIGVILFVHSLPVTSASPDSDGLDISAHDVERAWALTKEIVASFGNRVQPNLATLHCSPSAFAQTAADSPSAQPALIISILFALVLSAVLPAAFFVALVIVFTGIVIFARGRGSAQDRAKIRQAHTDATSRFQKALDAWTRNLELETLQAKAAEVETAYWADRGLETAAAERIAAYKQGRHAKQLAEYLDRFLIRRTKISGIGPAKLATLTSFGIESAADVVRQRILSIPGFGPTNSLPLLEWRDRLESRFVFNSALSARERSDLHSISRQVEKERAAARRAVVGGARELALFQERIRRQLTRVPEPLSRSYRDLEQAAADLRCIGINAPAPEVSRPVLAHRPKPKPAPQSPRQASPAPPTASATTRAIPQCPRCGSKMVRRKAQRGRNAGSHFWGCIRYPSCTGTRSTP